MAGSRLELVFGETPPEGRTLLIGADAATDLDMLDAARIAIVQDNFADHQALKARGQARRRAGVPCQRVPAGRLSPFMSRDRSPRAVSSPSAVP